MRCIRIDVLAGGSIYLRLIQHMPQAVGGHAELHDELTGPDVWPGNVHLHLWVVDLTDQAVSCHVRQIPDTQKTQNHS